MNKHYTKSDKRQKKGEVISMAPMLAKALDREFSHCDDLCDDNIDYNDDVLSKLKSSGEKLKKVLKIDTNIIQRSLEELRDEWK
jgi:hypothetical protein